MKILKIIAFFFFYIKELLASNVQILFDIVTPKDKSNHALLEVPLEVSTDFEIFLLTNLITITPGTICMDISEDGKILYVHDMYAHDPIAAVDKLKNSYEAKILEILR